MKSFIRCLVFSVLLLHARQAAATWTVTTASAAGVGGASTCDVTINSTSSNVLALLVSEYGAPNTGSISETGASANTWTMGPSIVAGADSSLSATLYYVLAPNTNAAHHVKYTGAYPACVVFSGAQGAATALSGSAVTNGTLAGGGTTIQAGSVGANNDLVLEGVAYYSNNGSNTIDGSFATPIQVNYSAGNTMGGIGSYKEVSGAVNPTWTFGAAQTAGSALGIAFTGVGGAAARACIVGGGLICE